MGDACLNRRQSPVQSPDGVKYPSVWLAGGQEPLRVIRMACALQQLATSNHTKHTHTRPDSVRALGCDTPGLHLGSTWAPPRLYLGVTIPPESPRDSIGDSTTPRLPLGVNPGVNTGVKPAGTYHVVPSSH